MCAALQVYYGWVCSSIFWLRYGFLVQFHIKGPIISFFFFEKIRDQYLNYTDYAYLSCPTLKKGRSHYQLIGLRSYCTHGQLFLGWNPIRPCKWSKLFSSCVGIGSSNPKFIFTILTELQLPGYFDLLI